MTEKTRDLDTRIVAAIERLSTATRSAMRQVTKNYQLTPLQLQILAYVAASGPEVTMGKLAAHLGLRPPTITDAVVALEQKRLLERARSPHDARTVHLRVLTAGKKVLTRLTTWSKVLREQLELLSDQEKGLLLNALLFLIRGFQQAGLISLTRMCTTCVFFEPDRYSDPQSPHYCRLLEQPLRLVQLQVDCPDHQRNQGTSAIEKNPKRKSAVPNSREAANHAGH